MTSPVGVLGVVRAAAIGSCSSPFAGALPVAVDGLSPHPVGGDCPPPVVASASIAAVGAFAQTMDGLPLDAPLRVVAAANTVVVDTLANDFHHWQTSCWKRAEQITAAAVLQDRFGH
ncbi:hypothetical protein SUGI_0778450 [Cryptomeria japonica]|nr:hypothetical protein SUGI_0778450 [Cryptomeria japonica]